MTVRLERRVSECDCVLIVLDLLSAKLLPETTPEDCQAILCKNADQERKIYIMLFLD
jgi:hypothetical protein